MSKTAIVPVFPTDWMVGSMQICSGMDRERYQFAVNARPAVPDELIEEAAKAMAALFIRRVKWHDLAEAVRNDYRNMARAAARVFNGGKDE